MQRSALKIMSISVLLDIQKTEKVKEKIKEKWKEMKLHAGS